MEDLTDDEVAVIDAIEEMTREKYVCFVEEHDPQDDDFLLVWTDNQDREWGVWFSRKLVSEIFTHAVLN